LQVLVAAREDLGGNPTIAVPFVALFIYFSSFTSLDVKIDVVLNYTISRSKALLLVHPPTLIETE
jgi:hypothetical protein